MPVQHKNLSSSQLHESKGVSAASAVEFNLALSSVNNWTTLHTVESVTASVSASIEFDNQDAFRELIISFDDILLSTSGNLAITVSSDNGSSYQATDYHTSHNQDGTGVSSSTHTSLFLAPAATTYYMSGKLVLTNFNKALVSTVKGHIHSNSAASFGGSFASFNPLGAINVATAWNAIKFTPTAGTITSGVITVEGLRS